MRPVLSIPTYWGRAGDARPGDAVYDHPTPLGTVGTLGRALRSISVLGRPDVDVSIVVAVTAPDLEDEAEAAVARIVLDAALPNPVHLVTAREISALRARVQDSGLSGLPALLSLRGYASVRNAQLVAAHQLGADAVVLIDDDEVIEESRFLDRIEENLRAGMDGFAGYYIDSGGDYLVTAPQEDWDVAWGKRQAMNEALGQLLAPPPDIKPTSLAFGGNMVLGRRLFCDVPFDPKITRGEDIDHVLGARLAGHPFHMDRTLPIRHLPPPHGQPRWQQLRQDILRFVYERDKLRGSGLQAADLGAYPGRFLGDDLFTRAQRALDLLALQYERGGDVLGAERTRETWELAKRSSHPRAFEDFMDLCSDWRVLMKAIG